MKKLFLAIVFSVPFLLFAQQKTGNLTVFSEDGDKFYLVLNGEKQNNAAQANLRLEELPQPYYNAKIIFADSSIATISKNNLMIASADNVMMDVTYKIRKDKNGKAKLNYFSDIEVQQDYIPPVGVHVYHYGKPAVVQVSNGTVLTTTTTTNNSSIVAANLNVNGVGVGMNVAIVDPLMQTTTTTTTTSNNYSNTNNNVNSNNGGCNGRPMNTTDFSAALKTISNGSFEETKLSTARSICSKNCLSADQVIKVCNLFGFEETKLSFAKHAYKHTTDRKNYFKVNDVFSFSSSKEELNKFIGEE
ncbi:MAG TPA: DUF4476 domain-containing protein [Ferruginibacter sp.]|nr:DUF4476 domain-containing protein [Ferruginibacter sp.]